MNPYLIPRKVPVLDRSKDWFRSCYMDDNQSASQLLWQSAEPYAKYRRPKHRDTTSCEGDQFQQCFLVYDPAADRTLVHLYYQSYVHAGYAGKVLRCHHADHRYYVLWVEEAAQRVSCIDYVRYHGSYFHEQGNSWWAKVALDREYTPLPVPGGTGLLRQRLGLPDAWDLDLGFLSARRDAPDTARYMGWYDYIVTADWRKEDTPYIEMRAYIDDTWHPRILYPTGQEAATQQLRIFEQELVACTWHPQRFLDWCIPACEKEELGIAAPSG